MADIKYILEIEIYDDEVEQFESVVKKIIELGPKRRWREELRIGNTQMAEYQIVGLQRKTP